MPSELPIGIAEDAWLAKIIGKDCFKLSLSTGYDQLQLDSFFKEQSSYFSFSKQNVNDIEQIASLTSLGFKLIDTNVQLLAGQLPQQEIEHKLAFRVSSKEDMKAVMKTAQESFVCSRFHLDPNTSNDLADKIKELWVGNYYQGMRGDHMVVAMDGQKCAGFLQILDWDNGFIIDLIASSPNYRKQGVAQNLIQFAINHLKPKKILVGTQIANIPSINLYEKVGFRFHKADYVFHKHK